ncbi:hypothetical protein ACEPXW_16250 [Pseudomonas aeruginosa]
MSSTQHQLIEQCATRLRGIVEALDNIHDNTPLRWSTDLDDVHSSAESLLALIKDQAPALDAQDLALRTIAESPCPEQDNMTAANMRQVAADAITGALAFGAQGSPAPEPEHWLRPFYDIGRAEGQRTQELAMLVRMLASSLKRHAPESNLVARATNYLAAKGLAGTPLRDAPASVEQAEAERPEVAEVAFVLRNIGAMDAEDIDGDNVDLRFEDAEGRDTGCDVSIVEYAEKAADLFEQHDRIVGALRADRDSWAEQAEQRLADWDEMRKERDAALARAEELKTMADNYCALLMDANAKLAELERQEPVAAVSAETFSSDGTSDIITRNLPIGTKLYANPVAQAGQVPQAWLDVQAERRRQVTAEGWTPEHDDQHGHGQMARAAACYALAGSSAPNDGTAALLVSLAWPWDQQWWKPTSARRDLVKACALALAEIERLDRACISQSPQPGATTASS